MGMWNLSNICSLFPQLRSTVLPTLMTKSLIQVSGSTVEVIGQDTEIKYLLVTKSHSAYCFPELGPLLAVDLMIKMSFLINPPSTEL